MRIVRLCRSTWLVQIRSAECDGCMLCVAACPARDALAMSFPRHRAVPAWMAAAGIAAIFLGVYGWAAWTGHWNTNLSDQVYHVLIPQAREFTHP